MATIKSYTDLSQSKKLAEILPLESADMHIGNYVGESGKVDGTNIHYYPKGESFGAPQIIDAWSLAALLSVLPNNEHITTTVSRGSWQIEPINYLPNTWWCEYEDSESLTEFNVSADNPVDACYKMILKLNKLNLL